VPSTSIPRALERICRSRRRTSDPSQSAWRLSLELAIYSLGRHACGNLKAFHEVSLLTASKVSNRPIFAGFQGLW